MQTWLLSWASITLQVWYVSWSWHLRHPAVFILGFTFTASCSGLSGFPCRNSATLPHCHTLPWVTLWNCGARFHDLLNLVCFTPAKQVSCGTMLPCSDACLGWRLGLLGSVPALWACVCWSWGYMPLVVEEQSASTGFLTMLVYLIITDTLSFALPLLKL